MDTQRLLKDFLWSAFEITAVDEDLTVATHESDAVDALAGIIFVGMENDNAVGVEVANPLLGLGIFGRNDLDRSRFVHAQGPLGDVKVMRSPIGHHTAGVFAVIAPGREMLVDAARAEG